VLNNIILEIASLLLILSIFVSYKKIVNEKIKLNIPLILILLIGSIINTILFFTDAFLIKTIFSLAVFVTIFKINSERKIGELCYYAFIIWIYGMLMDFINLIFISIIGLDVMLNMNVIYARLYSSIAMAILLYGFCSIKFIKDFTNKTVNKLIKIKNTMILDITIILSLVVLTTICILNINKVTITILLAITAALLVFCLYVTISKNYNIKRLKEVNSILIKNNEFYVKVDTDYRVFKHNLTNKLLGIKTVANDKAKKLIDDLIISYNTNFVASKDINKIPSGINGIIYEKFYDFEQKDINLAVDNSINSELVDIVRARTFNNLCEILGVLIDNALEASSKSAEKIILIDFKEDANYIIITLSNTFSSELDIDKLGEINYSTKNKDRGIGLFSIFRKIDIKTKTRIINNLFQTEIKIKKI